MIWLYCLVGYIVCALLWAEVMHRAYMTMVPEEARGMDPDKFYMWNFFLFPLGVIAFIFAPKN